MTRKKFVKHLMAAGMARNDAAECATLAQDAGREYSKVLGDLLNHHRARFKVRGLVGITPVRLCIIHGHKTPAYNVLVNGFYNRAAWAIMREGGGQV